jgi:hypothetical protein
METQELPWIRNHDWLSAIALLSLDLTRPFYESMGLQVPDLASFQTLLRSTIEDSLVAFVLVDPRQMDLLAIKKVLDGLTAMFSAEYGTAFTLWFVTIFVRRRNEWLMYESILIRWHAALRKRQEDTLGFSRRSEIVEAFRAARNLDDVKAAAAKARTDEGRRQRTSWDGFMYNLGLYVDGPELANGINDLFDAVRVRDPFENIEDVIEQNRFQLFWEILLKTAEPQMLDVLRDRAQQAYNATLPHPSELRRHVTWP